MTIQTLIGLEPGPLLACGPSDHLMTAVSRLVADGSNAIAVTGPEGQLVGILSDQDIIRALYAGGGSVSHSIVETWMTRNVITVKADTRLEAAVKLMAHHRIRHVVVTGESGAPLAVVGIRDILKKLHEIDELEISVLRDIAVIRR
ncbi:MAG: CBS domain-containing protein [Acidobacteria bacterium]|nr:CBS domain-containing protein [Acidobacteriota bacterium]